MAERWEERNRNEYRGDRGYPDRDRGMVDRAGDEVRSWFGDDEAARRRRMDELRDERGDREWSDRPGRSVERAWERTREAARDITDRDRDGRRGMAEWADDDRPAGARDTRQSYGTGGWSSGSSDYWNRERSFGDTRRYANADPYASASWTGPSYGARQDYYQRQDFRTSYAGRGPRGYQRSDARIREDVCDYLTDDPRVDASDIDIQITNGEVTLSGSVRSRDEKRYAEDAVERISGVREVNNNLKVKPADEVLGTARSGASTLGLTDTPPPAKK